MEEREKLENRLEEITEEYGVGNVLWTLVRTLSTDRLKELVNDIEWAMGE